MRTSIFITLLLALTIGMGRAEELLLPSVPQDMKRTLPTDPMDKRARRTRLNLPYLLKLPTNAPVTVSLPLFEDARYTAILDRYEPHGAGRFSWFGHLKNDPDSRLSLVFETDTALLELRIANKALFMVRPVGDGLYQVSELNTSLRLHCGNHQPVPLSQEPKKRIGIQATTEVDVLMFYTTQAKNSLGGTNGIRAQCQSAVDKANDVHENSETHVHLNMVGALELSNFDERNDYSAMLTDFTNNTYVRSQRDTYVADLAGLLVSNREVGSDLSLTNGIAWLYSNANAEYAYSVTNYLDATTGYVFAHESGHNFGCGHADSDPQSPGSFGYARGYKFTLNLVGLYRTVMAYDETGAFRTLIPYYSSPGLTYKVGLDSETIGISNYADNRRAVLATASTVAGYRNPDRTQVYVNRFYPGSRQNGTALFPFTSLGAALSVVASGGTIYMWQANYNELPTISTPVTLKNWNDVGPVNIGKP